MRKLSNPIKWLLVLILQISLPELVVTAGFVAVGTVVVVQVVEMEKAESVKKEGGGAGGRKMGEGCVGANKEGAIMQL